MATERPNIHLTIAAYGALLLQFIVVICGGIVWWFVSSHQSRIEYELGELRKEQTIVSTDLANEDLKYRRTTVVGLNCTILPTQLAHGIQQLDLVVNMRNEGLAALKIGELEVVVERGVPDAHVREALERASPELPPSTVPAEWKPALEELRGETKRFHSALQRYDDGDPRHSGELVRSMLSVSAKAFSFIHFIDRHETQWRPSRPPVPKLGIVDLSAKNIRWDALPDLHKSASLGRVLHKEQEHDRVFRFVLEAEPYDCYRFTVVARPAEGEEWGAVYAESTLPMVTLAATHYPTYGSAAPREIPVEISPSTEIPPKPDLFKRPMPD